MEELGSGLGTILARIGEFFHIFDLSFIVGGASTAAALSFLFRTEALPLGRPASAWIQAGAVILGCYICGMVSFAGGRGINSLTFRRRVLEPTLTAALKAHNLTGRGFDAYTGEKPDLLRLYIRMWSEVSYHPSGQGARHHLMRYWAMAATYDTVGFSFVIWALVLTLSQFSAFVSEPISRLVGVPSIIVSVLAAIVSFHRASAYFGYQIEDLVAYFAVESGSLLHPVGRESVEGGRRTT